MRLTGSVALFCLFASTSAIDKDVNARMPVLHEAPEGFHQAEGMLRDEYKLVKSHHHKRPRFLSLPELMDPLESRKIDSIANTTYLYDEVNYLRSYAVEECRQIVCSNKGKARFAQCAESLLSSDHQCREGCQDHLQMWVLKRCYMIETFDCSGNIGPGAVDPQPTVFNPEGPQTMSEFSESMKSLFGSKGVNCKCCDFSDVLMTKSSSAPLVAVFSAFLISLIA
jgi:hypothetical protein